VQPEDFCLSAQAGDVEAVRKTLAQCKNTDRFVGEFCAKLFIAEPVDLQTLLGDGPEKNAAV